MRNARLLTLVLSLLWPGVPKIFSTWILEEHLKEPGCNEVIIAIKSMDGNYLQYDTESGELVARQSTFAQLWKKHDRTNSSTAAQHSEEKEQTLIF